MGTQAPPKGDTAALIFRPMYCGQTLTVGTFFLQTGLIQGIALDSISINQSINQSEL